MTAAGDAFAGAAEQLVGSPFRLGGRDPACGLDCVGVVAAAFATLGRPYRMPEGYRIRQIAIGTYLDLAEHCGLAVAGPPFLPGDVLLVRPGPAQHHLLVASRSGGFVHAHAGLRKVVHGPVQPDWPVLRHWRLKD